MFVLHARSTEMEEEMAMELRYSDKNKEEQQKLQYLASNISITGIKFILGRDATPARRCVWLMFILAAVTWMAWNIGQQVALFLSNPTSVSSSVTVHDVITFPQVTLCNQNPVRSSKMFEMNGQTMRSPTMYEALDRFFLLINNDITATGTATTTSDNNTQSAESNGVDKFMSQYGDLLHGVDMANFMWSTAQDKATFIQRPGWELQLTLLSGSFKGLAILDRFILFVNNTILHYLRNDFASVKTLNDSLFKILHDPTNDAEKENISRAVDALEALKSNLDCNANAWQQVDSTKRRFLNTAPIQLLQDVSREQSNVNTNKLNTTDVDVELETLNREFYE
nr:hypothetical protein BaRGS_029934 [Batillaria attramentaria]